MSTKRSKRGMNEPFITLSRATLRQYDRLVFRNTDWAISKGEQWAVVGPNGSGKSTLARALWGGVPVVRGALTYHFDEDRAAEDVIQHVTFDDQHVAALAANSYHQARWHSGEDDDSLSVDAFLSPDVVYGVNPFEVREAPLAARGFRRRRTEVVGLMEIAPLLGKKVIHLSSGESRKVRVAHALLRDPQLFILDEPFAGLDRESRAMLRRLVGRLIERSVQVMLLTTRPEDVMPGITHILRVEGSRVVGQGPRRAMMRALAKPEPVPASGPGKKTETARSRTPRASGPELLRLSKNSVAYGRVAVLKDVSWTVRQGEQWGLLGPNGSGKTTLLGLILGDHPQAYANSIELFGRPRGTGESVWELKQRIGWVSPELHIHCPDDGEVLDVICSGFFDSLGLFESCSPAQRRRARQVATRLGLRSLLGKRLEELSCGEQRTVLLARAVVKTPALLLLDEPCQGLDATHRGTVLRLLDKLAEQGDVSMVYVTHRPNELPGCLTHVLKLRAGRVIQRGPLRKS